MPPDRTLPSVQRKKRTAAFDGGVMLLGAIEKMLGIAETLAARISDARNPLFITHSVADILRARMLAIACGYEDGDDLDHLHDERYFVPIDAYDTATSQPVAVLLRPGTTPSGKEVRGYPRRLAQRIRTRWPTTRITFRGDGRYGRPEVMA